MLQSLILSVMSTITSLLRVVGLGRCLPVQLDDITDTRTDAVEQSRSRSSSPEEEKSVHFDLNPQEEPSREPSREPSPKREDSDPDDHAHRQRRRRRDDEHSHSSREPGRDRKRHHRDESPGSDASDATIELPPRFDERGRQKPEDPLAETLETVLSSIFR